MEMWWQVEWYARASAMHSSVQPQAEQNRQQSIVDLLRRRTPSLTPSGVGPPASAFSASSSLMRATARSVCSFSASVRVYRRQHEWWFAGHQVKQSMKIRTSWIGAGRNRRVGRPPAVVLSLALPPVVAPPRDDGADGAPVPNAAVDDAAAARADADPAVGLCCCSSSSRVVAAAGDEASPRRRRKGLL